MNAKEKYNNIINTIETLVQESTTKEPVSDNEILERAFKAGNAEIMAPREKNALFCFMTGNTPRNYITERRMMLAYKMLISRDTWGLNEEYWLSGVDSPKGFITKFKKIFGITPGKAFNKKDESLIQPPKTWEVISDDFKHQICLDLLDGNKSNMRFGIDVDAFIKAKMAENLQEHYGLNDLEAELAFDIADKNSLDFDSVFEYVYGYVWQYIDPLPNIRFGQYEKEEYNPNPKPETRDLNIVPDLTDPDIIRLYFKLDLGFADIISVLSSLCDPRMSEYSDDEVLSILCDPRTQEPRKPLSEYSDDEIKTVLEESKKADQMEEAQRQENMAVEYYLMKEEATMDAIMAAYYDYALDESEYDYYYDLDYDNNDEYEEYEEYEYNMDNYDDYLRLYEEVESHPESYRGNVAKRMPEGYVCIFGNTFDQFDPFPIK